MNTSDQFAHTDFWCYGNLSTAPTVTTRLFDAANDQIAWCFQVVKTGNIETIKFNVGNLAGGGSASMEASIQSLDITGIDVSGNRAAPDGTKRGTQTFTLTDNTDDNTHYPVTFTTPVAVTRGEYIAVVLLCTALNGGMTACNIITQGGINFRPAQYFGWPMVMTDIAGSATWTTNSTDGARGMFLSVGYDDGEYPEMWNFFPHSASGGTFAQINVGTDQTPDEAGNYYVFGADTLIDGFWFNGRWNAALLSADVILYEGETSPVAQRTETINGAYGVLHTVEQVRVHYFTDGPYKAKAGTPYRLVFKPSTTGVDFRLVVLEAATAAEVGHMFDSGSKGYRTQRTDGGTFTETTTDVVSIGPLFSGFNASAAPHLVNGGLVR